jgi:predicted TIM-barrel fold metal-dependent hydrolase
VTGRRATFLAGAAAFGLAAATGGGAQAQPAPGIPRIDVHHHFFPPQYLREAHPEHQFPPPMAQWTPDKSLGDMDRGGVTTAMLSITTPGLYYGKTDEARHLARLCNDYAAGLIRQYPKRFGLFAALPLPDVPGSLAETMYALDTLKAEGIGMFTSYDGKIWLGSSVLDPLFTELDRRGALVFVHPTSNACCADILEPNVDDSVIEYQTETTRAIGNYLFSGAAQRFPNVRLIFSHAGGTMPFLIGRFLTKALDPKFGARVSGGVVSALGKFYYDTAQTANVEAMGALSKVVPPSHILFGTDFPYGNAARDGGNLQTCGFGAAELNGIFAANATALLGRRTA